MRLVLLPAGLLCYLDAGVVLAVTRWGAAWSWYERTWRVRVGQA